MRPVLVISPHLDDAVLSVGQFLAGRPEAVVVTLFAAVPDAGVLTEYDKKCGFSSSKDAVSVRRDEDKEALAVLKATPIHLDFWDQQYGIINDAQKIADELMRISLEIEPDFVLAPLGLLHSDHELAHQVALRAFYERHLRLYEELPYRVTHPEAAQKRLSIIDPVEPWFGGDGPLERKLTAIWSYKSQMGLPEFANIHNFCVPERFWRPV